MVVNTNSFEENLIICQGKDENKVKTNETKTKETKLKKTEHKLHEMRNGII